MLIRAAKGNRLTWRQELPGLMPIREAEDRHPARVREVPGVRVGRLHASRPA